MGILDSFERGLERAVNGAFAKTFKSGLQPIEITAALRRELDTRSAVVSRHRILAPNMFTVSLSDADYRRMNALGPALIEELTALVQQHANEQGYQFAGAITIQLTADSGLSDGLLEVASENTKGDVAWTPVLEINGTVHPLVKARTVIGRGHDADITVADTGISRKHVEVLWDGSRGQVNDLGSTNGSELNGQRVTRAPLAPESVISIGRTKMIFRVLPQSAPAASRSRRPAVGGNRAEDAQ